ncbi:hypothetical protein [Vibrio phage LP.1]|nr:hypothetical protein [Vibrio phage LP.1]
MADTIPNIVIPAKTVVDIYADPGVIAAGIAVGDAISVKMIGNGLAKLYSGAALAGEPKDSDGYYPIYPREDIPNNQGDAGAFIWSRQGCTINVRAV